MPFLVEGEWEPRQRTAKKVILDEMEGLGGKCSRQDLQEAFMRERPGTKWESVKRGFNKAIQELQDDGIIDISGDSVILKSDDWELAGNCLGTQNTGTPSASLETQREFPAPGFHCEKD